MKNMIEKKISYENEINSLILLNELFNIEFYKELENMKEMLNKELEYENDLIEYQKLEYIF